LRVSELALGTMTFSSSKLPRGDRPSPGARWSWCATEDDARRIFASYVNGGGNFVDTADIYAGGTAEHLVGELVAPIRERVVLATKFGLSTREDDVTTSGSSYRRTLNAVERSLRRLGNDRIDLLWLHAWDGITPIDEVARVGCTRPVGQGALRRCLRCRGVGCRAAPCRRHRARLCADHRGPASRQRARPRRRTRTPPMARQLGIGVAALPIVGARTPSQLDDALGRSTSTSTAKIGPSSTTPRRPLACSRTMSSKR